MKNKKTEQLLLQSIIIVSLAALLSFTGCASLSLASDNDAMEITELINEGNSSELTKLSAESFLLDTEILHSSSLIGELWTGLADAGFKLANPVIIENRALKSSDTGLFGNTKDVEVFFARYLPENAKLFRIGSDNAEIVLILGPSEKGKNNIIAFGGPF